MELLTFTQGGHNAGSSTLGHMNKLITSLALAASLVIGGWAGLTTYHLAATAPTTQQAQAPMAVVVPATPVVRTVTKVAPCPRGAKRVGAKCVKTVVKHVHTTIRVPVSVPVRTTPAPAAAAVAGPTTAAATASHQSTATSHETEHETEHEVEHHHDD